MIVNSQYRLFFGLCLMWVALILGCGEYTAYQHLDRALRHEGRGHADQALSAFEEAVASAPQDAYLRRRLGWAYVQRSQFEAAHSELTQALLIEPHYLAVYQDLATLAETQGTPEVAVGWLEKAVQEVPDYMPSYRDLSAVYISMDRLSDAQVLLEKMVKQWPKTLWAHYRLGGLFMQLKWPERAEAAFKQVIDFNPTTEEDYALFIEAHGALGNVYYEQKNYDRAIEFYQKAIDLNPADHSSMNNLAWVYAVQGTHLQEGIRLSRRSLRLNPHAPTYLDTLAELFYKLGDHKQAEEIVRQAIALQPDDPELRAHLHRQLAKFLSSGLGKA